MNEGCLLRQTSRGGSRLFASRKMWRRECPSRRPGERPTCRPSHGLRAAPCSLPYNAQTWLCFFFSLHLLLFTSKPSSLPLQHEQHRPSLAVPSPQVSTPPPFSSRTWRSLLHDSPTIKDSSPTGCCSRPFSRVSMSISDPSGVSWPRHATSYRLCSPVADEERIGRYCSNVLSPPGGDTTTSLLSSPATRGYVAVLCWISTASVPEKAPVSNRSLVDAAEWLQTSIPIRGLTTIAGHHPSNSHSNDGMGKYPKGTGRRDRHTVSPIRPSSCACARVPVPVPVCDDDAMQCGAVRCGGHGNQELPLRGLGPGSAGRDPGGGVMHY